MAVIISMFERNFLSIRKRNAPGLHIFKKQFIQGGFLFQPYMIVSLKSVFSWPPIITYLFKWKYS